MPRSSKHNRDMQVQITDLPNALPLTGAESVPIVQNGVTVRTTTGAISGAGALNYPFLTVGSTAGLPDARYLTTGSGLSLTDGGAGTTLQINLTGAALSLDSSGTGLVVKTGPNTVTGRSLTVGAGLSISNADGVSGNPTISLGAFLTQFISLTGTGVLAIQSGSVGKISVLGTTNQISIANGDGSSDITVSLASNPVIPGTGSVTIPVGTTGQQPAGSVGMLRYNSTTDTFDGYTTLGWSQFSVAGGVTSFSGGSTGLTPSTASTGAVVLGGTLNVGSGGTGAATLTGYVKGNGTSAFTASVSVPTSDLSGTISNAQLANSAVTFNGVTVSLGGSGTIPFVLSNALTIGTGLSGGSYDGSAAVTIAIDSTVATLTGSQTLTNKTMSGVSNTFSNIPNSGLTNSSITINGSSVSLGGSTTVTASTTGTLTLGTGLTGTSFNGSTNVTTAIDTSVVATLTGTQTLTNKSMSGSNNTFLNIPNSALSNSTISGVSLGSNLYTLTIGTGLTGTSYNGSGAVTVAIDSTVATLSGVQTFTNKSISGSANTLTNIPNSSLTNSSVTIGSTAISLGATSLTLAGLTSVTLTQDPSADLQAATKQYVDAKASTGLVYHDPVQAGTTASLASTTGGTVTYNNGSAGVGATITLSVPLTVLDGYTLLNTNRILVKNEVNQAYNGIYTWATGGTVLTRATDADTYGSAPGQLSQNDYFFIQNGTVNRGSSYVVTTVGVITFGTTAITFAEFSNSQVYTAGTGLTLTGTTFSITNTGVTNGSYGTASSVPTIAINAQGQITSASNTAIAINGNQITSGTIGSAYISGSYTGITGVGTLTAGTWNASTIGVGYGGTGLASYTAGDLLYASGTTTLSKLGIGTSTYILTSSGSAPQWTAPSSVSIGTATNLAGGTAGALPYQTGAGATSFLALGTTNYVLTAGASAPQYVAQSTLSVGSATNATNTAITANSTNATNYLTFVSATTGNLPQLVNSAITCNPSTGQITGGIAGGSF